jgi:hypothetical protein
MINDQDTVGPDPELGTVSSSYLFGDSQVESHKRLACGDCQPPLQSESFEGITWLRGAFPRSAYLSEKNPSVNESNRHDVQKQERK